MFQINSGGPSGSAAGNDWGGRSGRGTEVQPRAEKFRWRGRRISGSRIGPSRCLGALLRLCPPLVQELLGGTLQFKELFIESDRRCLLLPAPLPRSGAERFGRRSSGECAQQSGRGRQAVRQTLLVGQHRPQFLQLTATDASELLAGQIEGATQQLSLGAHQRIPVRFKLGRGELGIQPRRLVGIQSFRFRYAKR